MKKNKFKVGERYIVDAKHHGENGNIIEIYENHAKYKLIEGKEGWSRFGYGSNFVSYLKPINKQEIHITTDGYKTTYGILKENGKVVKKVEANLHPSDTFDFMVGSSIVMGRLFEKEDAPETIKVGDMIKVVDTGCYFPSYKNWFKENGCEYLASHFVENREPLNSHEYKVVAIGKHNKHPEVYGVLYAIQNLDTTQVFIINEEGIEKV